MTLWDTNRDQELRRAIKNAGSIRAAARELGISENAAIARRNRMRGVVFPSDLKKQVEIKAERLRRSEERNERAAAVLAVMQRDIDNGIRRDWAIRVAYKKGITFAEIARYFGLTRSRIQQIFHAQPVEERLEN